MLFQSGRVKIWSLAEWTEKNPSFNDRAWVNFYNIVGVRSGISGHLSESMPRCPVKSL